MNPKSYLNHFPTNEKAFNPTPQLGIINALSNSTLEKPISGDMTGEQLPGAMNALNVETKELTTFINATDDPQVTGTATFDSFPAEDPSMTDVLTFLKRPVRIATYTWETLGAQLEIDPWTLFFQDVAVSRKIANYKFIKTGGLKITIQTNGNPYAYGLFHIGYWPFAASDKTYTTIAKSDPCRISTLPCFCSVEAGSNSVISMNIPEHSTQRLSIVDGFSLGKIVGFGATALATTSTLTPVVNFVIYAELVDPHLYLNTTKPPAYATSGKSEWKGKASAPLHKVSEVAASLSMIPVIGPYATAVGSAASMGASIAKALGFSKPPDVRDKVVTIRKTIGNMNNTSGLDITTVLAADPNAQTSVDPSIVGLPSDDEMCLKFILQRPSLCHAGVWTDEDEVDAFTDTIGNTPNKLYSYENALATGTWSPLTNLAYVCGLFKEYRGTIKYRVKFVSSRFHTGRIQIIFEPNPTILTTLDQTNVTLNWVVDLSQSTEVEFELPFCNGAYFINNSGDYLLGTTNAYNQQATANGTITFKVLTPLRCGSQLSTSIQYLIYNSAGDDFAVVNPTQLQTRNETDIVSWYPYTTPAALPAATAYRTWGTSSNSELIANTLYSENVVSFRNLLKRYTFTNKFSMSGGSGVISYKTFRAFPSQTGTINNGSYVQLIDRPLGFLTYLAPAFAMYRGGIRKKLIPINPSVSGLITSVLPLYSSNNNKAGNATETSTQGYTIRSTCLDGAYTEVQYPYVSLTPLEFTVPYIARTTASLTSSAVNDMDSGYAYALTTVGDSYSADFHEFTAAADDFSFYYYIGAPISYRYPPGTV